MCHCGDSYCDLREDARVWANAEHSRLRKSDDEVQACPDLVIREVFIINLVRSRVREKFGADALDFRWDKSET